MIKTFTPFEMHVVNKIQVICHTTSTSLYHSFLDASLCEYGDPAEFGKGGYKLSVSKLNSIYFQNIPLDCFESVELSSTVGTAAESKLTQRKSSCCGLFSCIGVSTLKQFEPPHDKISKMKCAPSEDSDQPGHPPSLISLYYMHSIGS